MKSREKMQSRSGFTLIEVVVVLAVVMLLYAVISPALFAARTRAKETQCASNMHQDWLAMQMYRQDDNGDWPNDPPHYIAVTYPATPSLLICPLEYRDLLAMSPEPQNLGHETLSSYAWPCCAGLMTDAVYARRGEQTAAIMCDVHSQISSGAPFFQVVRFDGSLSHVPANKLIEEGDSWNF